VAERQRMLYVVMQDPQGSVHGRRRKTMKAIAHYPFGDKRQVQRAGVGRERIMCYSRLARAQEIAAQPAQPMMVI